MTRAAIYTRVSTLEQARDKSSLTIQLERSKAYCAAHEWEVTGHYEDAGQSGKNRERPALVKLMTHAKEGHFDIVVFAKLDRFARSLRDLQNIVHELKELKVGAASVHEGFDTTTPAGRLFLAMLGGFAEFEADVINERMSGGRQASFANGKAVLSCTPYGYEKQDGVLVEHPKDAPTLRRIFNMSAQGMGALAVASVLNDEGISSPKGKRWSHTGVHKLLGHRRYVGEVKYCGEERTDGLALIDEKLFVQVQQGLRTRRQYENPHTSNDRVFHLLSRLLRCGRCGGSYSAVKWGDSRRYYCSTAKREGKDLRHKDVKSWWKPDELETAAVRFITDFMEDPMAVLSLIREWHDEHAGLADEDRLPGLETALKQHDEERKSIIRLARKGRIEEADMVEQLAEVKRAKAETETQIAEVKAARVVDPGEVEVVGALIRKRDEAYIINHEEDPSTWSKQALQTALRHVIEEIIVEDDGTFTAVSRYLECDQTVTRSWSGFRKFTAQLPKVQDERWSA